LIWLVSKLVDSDMVVNNWNLTRRLSIPFALWEILCSCTVYR
jgi:hypothetical protein